MENKTIEIEQRHMSGRVCDEAAFFANGKRITREQLREMEIGRRAENFYQTNNGGVPSLWKTLRSA